MPLQDFLQEYVVEVKEHLQELERSLLILEREGADAVAGGIGEIFRAAHSIKGISSYMGYEGLAGLTHEMENLIGEIRAGKRSITPQGVNAMLGCVDFISGALEILQENGEEPPFPSALLQQLQQALSAESSGDSENPRGPAGDNILENENMPRAVSETNSRATGAEPEEEYEEDEELLSIFLDSFQDVFSQLVAFFFSSEQQPGASGDRAEALLERLIASSRYMNYTSIADLLEELKRAIAEPGDDAAMSRHHYGELTVNCGRRLQQILPALRITTPQPSPQPPDNAVETEPESPVVKEEEDDEELFAIFMDSFRENLSQLASAAPSSPDSPIGGGELEEIRTLLAKLASSSRYMGYDSVVSIITEWEEMLLESGDGGILDAKLYKELFESFADRLRVLLPGLEAMFPTILPELRESVIADTIDHELDATFRDLDNNLMSPSFGTDPSFDRSCRSRPADTEHAIAESPLIGPGDSAPETPFPPGNGLSPAPESMSMEPAGRPAALSVEPPGPPSHETARERGPITAIAEETPLEATLRVNARKVDELLNQVGELVVTRSEFMQTAAFLKEMIRELAAQGRLTKQELRKLRMLSFRLNESTLSMGRITNDLQNSVMRVRMLPISHLFRRFPRIVRDQAMKLGKRVELIMEGGETEVDKRVLEQMNDPLVQLLRNAIAHGMEAPMERRSREKADTGAISLSARHEGDHVVIEIEDDGRGIDSMKIRRALQSARGMDARELERLSDREINYAVFLPGISTHDRVDATAGRGVGLDVVKENVERLSGSIEVESAPGVGTRFTIRIPLTVAIIRALLVEVMDQVFTLPLTSVSEIFRYEAGSVYSIESFQVVSIRDKTVPLVRLSSLLGMPDYAGRPCGDRKFVVVVNTSFQEVGLVVDSLVGEREVVIKPIEDEFHSFDGFSGATILGDGSISLILDVSTLLGTIEDVRRAGGRSRESVLHRSAFDCS